MNKKFFISTAISRAKFVKAFGSLIVLSALLIFGQNFTSTDVGPGDYPSATDIGLSPADCSSLAQSTFKGSGGIIQAGADGTIKHFFRAWLSNCLTKDPTFQGNWAADNPKLARNGTGSDLVLKSMKVTLGSDHAQLIRNLGVDVCLKIFDRSKIPVLTSPDAVKNLSWSAPSSSTSTPTWSALTASDALVSGNEVLCLNRGKDLLPSEAFKEFANNEVVITFPGQGLLIPNGSNVICSAQGSAIGESRQVAVKTPSAVASFSCELDMAPVDTSLSAARIFQTIRTPYFDESFSNTNISRQAAHTNLSGQDLILDGVWLYNNAKGVDHKICLQVRNFDGTASQDCASEDSRELNETGKWSLKWTRTTPQPYQRWWKAGERISAACHLTNYKDLRAGENPDCAFYIFTSIPFEIIADAKSPAKKIRKYTALLPGDTIPKAASEQYCNRLSSTVYDISSYYHLAGLDFGFQVDTAEAHQKKIDRCNFMLEQKN